MSFLQPWMLAALPLALLPIIIHLINQRRYQSTQWAAMMFLLTANRMNRGYARIRQWLILALRTLVIAALIFAIGRPIASGLLGGSIASVVTGRGTATTIVLLDRSPSMQASSDAASSTKLRTGVEQIASALETIGTERLVLIDSNTASPQELAAPADLLTLPESGPSDASADVPAMLLAALEYLNANESGQTDVWICSDLRSHDWRAEDGRWATLRDAFTELGRRVRFRLLAFPGETDGSSSAEPANNLSVRVDDARLETGETESAVLLSLTVKATGEGAQPADQSVPVTLNLDESRSLINVEMHGGVGKIKGHRVVLPRDQERGYGSVSIPADPNLADNEFYFSFDAPVARRTVVVSDDEEVARVLKLAAEITPKEGVSSEVEVISPSAAVGVSWENVSLVLWQAELPDASRSSDAPNPSNASIPADSPAVSDDFNTPPITGVAGMLQTLVDRGGRVIFFPPDSIAPASKTSPNTGSAVVGSVRWDAWHEVEGENAVSSWRGDADLLAATLAGTALSVGTLQVHRYASVSGEASTLASLADGSPLLWRVPTPHGGVYFCSTTPKTSDSSLAADGVVLYIMIQRALQAGTESLGNTSTFDAGEAPAEIAEKWRRLIGPDSALSSENAFVAGVFQPPQQERLIVVNRSAGEDAATRVSDGGVESLFAGLPLVRVDQQAGSSRSLVDELWRAFLILMLLAMIGEACLCLPRVRDTQPKGSVPKGASA